MDSQSMRCTLGAWASTAILATLSCLASVTAHAHEATPPEIVQPELEPAPPRLPEPEIVQPPEAPPVLIPTAVEWRIPEPDAALADEHRWTSVWCGRSADETYSFGRFDFKTPSTRGVVQLPGPAHCVAVAYYWVAAEAPKFPTDGYYRYSEPSPAVLVDPLKPAAPELMPAGMETATLQCAASTQRCVTSRLQTETKARDGVRVRSCSCVLVEQ